MALVNAFRITANNNPIDVVLHNNFYFFFTQNNDFLVLQYSSTQSELQIRTIKYIQGSTYAGMDVYFYHQNKAIILYSINNILYNTLVKSLNIENTIFVEESTFTYTTGKYPHLFKNAEDMYLVYHDINNKLRYSLLNFTNITLFQPKNCLLLDIQNTVSVNYNYSIKNYIEINKHYAIAESLPPKF